MSAYSRIREILSLRPQNQLRVRKSHGGISPPGFKEASLRSRILPAPIPPELILPLRQHQGSSPRVTVAVGDSVLKGDLLAEVLDLDSLPLHAPTSGKITAIGDFVVAASGATTQECIVLEPDGHDRWRNSEKPGDYNALSRNELLLKIQEAGIAGMGGAGFPTFKKLFTSFQRGVDLLIVNAVECEPYISADEALLREFAQQVVQGCEVFSKLCACKRCVIVLEKGKPDALRAIKNALEGTAIEFALVDAKYPAGSEQQLVHAVTGLEIPREKRPSDYGVILQNVGTVFAIYKAIILGQPNISRITTVTGTPLQTPKNFEVLLGTPVSFLFEICGADFDRVDGAIMGGSLMGVTVPSLDVPVMRTTNCLIATTTIDFPPAASEQPCIRCGACAAACPVKLLPQQLLAFSKTEADEQLSEYGIMDCIECGACDYVCPSSIPLVSYFQQSKSQTRKREAQQRRSEYWLSRYGERLQRLEVEKANRSARARTSKNNPPVSRLKSAQLNPDQAKLDIADAVARVRAKRSQSSSGDSPSSAGTPK